VAGEDAFVLGVDIDGVVGDFYAALRPIAAEWRGVPEESLPLDVSYGLREWRLDDTGGYEDLHRFAVTQRNLFRDMPLRNAGYPTIVFANSTNQDLEAPRFDNWEDLERCVYRHYDDWKSIR